MLKAIGMILDKRLRKSDFVARIGGEEFVLLLPETSLDNGFRLAESICRLVEKSVFRLHGKRLEVTASLGVDQNAQSCLCWTVAYDRFYVDPFAKYDAMCSGYSWNWTSMSQ